jgi:hypothetical protein
MNVRAGAPLVALRRPAARASIRRKKSSFDVQLGSSSTTTVTVSPSRGLAPSARATDTCPITNERTKKAKARAIRGTACPIRTDAPSAALNARL